MGVGKDKGEIMKYVTVVSCCLINIVAACLVCTKSCNNETVVHQDIPLVSLDGYPYEVITLAEMRARVEIEVPSDKLNNMITFTSIINGKKSVYGYIMNSGHVIDLLDHTVATNIPAINKDD